MRENRITAIGNDLYSANSRSFLNPFLGILRRALFPFSKRTLWGPACFSSPFFSSSFSSSPSSSFSSFSPSSSSLVSSIASLQLLSSSLSSIFSTLSISPSLLKLLEKFLVRYTFPRAEIVLSHKSCSSFPPFFSLCSLLFFLSLYTVLVRHDTRKHKSWRELCTSITRARIRVIHTLSLAKAFPFFVVAEQFYGFHAVWLITVFRIFSKSFVARCTR